MLVIKRLVLAIFLMQNMILPTTTLPSLAYNSQSAPNSVTDYYLALPVKYMPILESFKNRRSLLKIEDTKNGYLRIESKEWEGWGEVAIFKKNSGSYLVAAVQYECGPVCMGEPHFLSYNNGKWQEEKVLPALTDKQLIDIYRKKAGKVPDEESIVYNLPRQGRDISITVDNVKVYKLSWDGAKFNGSVE